MKYYIIVTALLFTSLRVIAQSDIEAYNTAMNNKDYQLAVNAITNILKDASRCNEDVYYKRAVAYAAMGNYIYAISDCTSALSYNKNSTKAYYLRGQSKLYVGDPTYIKDMQNGGREGLDYLNGQKNNQSVEIVNLKSDIDTNIPIEANISNNTFVLIFSNEHYLENNISSVRYANNDGNIFKQYCLKTLGIPKDNIHLRHDATRNQMRSEVKWIQNVADAFGKKANIIFYYSGHGMPDEENGRAYLLPSDGIANDPESAYSLSSLYEQLGKMDVNNVIVFLDACFSGSQRDGGMLTASKGVAIKPKEEILGGKICVLAASQGDETAYPYNEKEHGLFTYFLLKKLQETKGNVTLHELGNYVTEKVLQTSIVKNGRKQTPTINTAYAISETWRNIRLK